MVRRLHRPVRARARAAVRHRAGDRVAALDALAAVAQPAHARCSRGIAVLVLAAAARRTPASSPLSLAMFALGTFAIGIGVQELWRGMRARQAMTGEAPPAALVGVVRRNRRRYGGYIVHIGISVLFIGVAASSAFNHERDVRLQPGQSARVGGYVFTYERADGADRAARRRARADRARLARARDEGRQDGRGAAPRARLLPDQRADDGRAQPLLRGQRDERDRPEARACGATSGSPSSPTSARCSRSSRRATRVFARAGDDLPADQRARTFLGQRAGRPRRPLPRQRAGGAVPRARLAADHVPLARRADRPRAAGCSRRGRSPARCAGACAPATRRASPATSGARSVAGALAWTSSPRSS